MENQISAKRKIFDIKALVALLFLLVLVLIGIAGQLAKENSNPQFIWENPDDEKKYLNAAWNEINTPRLDGLTSGGKLIKFVELSSRCGFGLDEKCHMELLAQGILAKGEEWGKFNDYDYLRREGCGSKIYYYLELMQNGEPVRVNTQKRFIGVFAPVDNEMEAMSFIAATMPDLKVVGDTLVGYTATIEDGYLVKAIAKDTCWCSSHIPYLVIFKVARNGEISVPAYEKREESGPYSCID